MTLKKQGGKAKGKNEASEGWFSDSGTSRESIKLQILISAVSQTCMAKMLAFCASVLINWDNLISPGRFED